MYHSEAYLYGGPISEHPIFGEKTTKFGCIKFLDCYRSDQIIIN